MKHSTKTLHPEPSTKTLANALTQYIERKSEQPIRTYTERIRELVEPSE